MIQIAIICFSVVVCGRACGHRDLPPAIGIIMALVSSVAGAFLMPLWLHSERIDETIGSTLLGTITGAILAAVVCACLPDGSSSSPENDSGSGPYQRPRNE